MLQQPYGACVLQSAAELRAPGAPPPRVRVACIGPAGAGACWFHGWGYMLPSWVEVLPVELPQRNTRLRERMPVRPEALTHGPRLTRARVAQADLHALVRDLARDLAPGLCAGVTPYALVGHSFGAWVAYELARALPTPPIALYASANRAPQLAGPSHDPDPEGASLASLADEAEFWRRFEGRYGRNPDLQHPAVRRFVLPLLRADFGCLEASRGPPAGQAALSCRLVATGAKGDARYTPQQLSAWAACTTGRFTERWEEPPPHAWATPHRFLADAPRPFLAFLEADLAALLAAAQAAPAEQAGGARAGATA